MLVTSNGDKGRQREVRQHKSPFQTVKRKNMATNFWTDAKTNLEYLVRACFIYQKFILLLNIVTEICMNKKMKQGLYKRDKALRASTPWVPKITSLVAIPHNTEALHCPFLVQIWALITINIYFKNNKEVMNWPLAVFLTARWNGSCGDQGMSWLLLAERYSAHVIIIHPSRSH